MRFNKPSRTFEEQLDILIQRGMTVADRDEALHYLSHLNYYRLGAYWLPFEKDHKNHTFKPGTSFSDVLNLYVFDRELRLLVMDAVELIEVSLRCQIAYHLSHAYGPHAHLKPELYFNPITYGRTLSKLEMEVRNSSEDFIRHLRKKYDELLPPIWAVVELMTLGQLSGDVVQMVISYFILPTRIHID